GFQVIRVLRIELQFVIAEVSRDGISLRQRGEIFLEIVVRPYRRNQSSQSRDGIVVARPEAGIDCRVSEARRIETTRDSAGGNAGSEQPKRVCLGCEERRAVRVPNVIDDAQVSTELERMRTLRPSHVVCEIGDRYSRMRARSLRSEVVEAAKVHIVLRLLS